ncbi:homeobox KN domain-containing protein [Xylariaceae sp. FL0662B]|nr:homeobox KN domain-containing protein [Xylariaceae sp. FL0662B]
MHIRHSSATTTYSLPVKKTQILRTWFSGHLNHPYPSKEEKASLAQRSRLSRTQVTDWFSNVRRRHRMSTRSIDKTIFPQGSPMPSPPMSSMTPFERWRRSPPDEEPVSESVVQEGLGML